MSRRSYSFEAPNHRFQDGGDSSLYFHQFSGTHQILWRPKLIVENRFARERERERKEMGSRLSKVIFLSECDPFAKEIKGGSGLYFLNYFYSLKNKKIEK